MSPKGTLKFFLDRIGVGYGLEEWLSFGVQNPLYLKCGTYGIVDCLYKVRHDLKVTSLSRRERGVKLRYSEVVTGSLFCFHTSWREYATPRG